MRDGSEIYCRLASQRKGVSCEEWHFLMSSAGLLNWIWPLLLKRRLKELVNENLRGILGPNRIVWVPGQRGCVFPKLTPVNHWLRAPQGDTCIFRCFRLSLPVAWRSGKTCWLSECKAHHRDEEYAQTSQNISQGVGVEPWHCLI